MEPLSTSPPVDKLKLKDGISFSPDVHKIHTTAKQLQRLQSSGSSIGSLTYANQYQLPRLPIPTLEETLEKFTATLEALQDNEQRDDTKRVVQEFQSGPGPALQQALLDYEAESFKSGEVGSYVEEFWNESYRKSMHV
jgi:carnitine O-acetyltransferase